MWWLWWVRQKRGVCHLGFLTPTKDLGFWGRRQSSLFFVSSSIARHQTLKAVGDIFLFLDRKRHHLSFVSHVLYAHWKIRAREKKEAYSLVYHRHYRSSNSDFEYVHLAVRRVYEIHSLQNLGAKNVDVVRYDKSTTIFSCPFPSLVFRRPRVWERNHFTFRQPGVFVQQIGLRFIRFVNYRKHGKLLLRVKKLRVPSRQTLRKKKATFEISLTKFH